MKDQALIETMKHLIVIEKSVRGTIQRLVQMFVTDKMHISIESNLFAWE